MASLTRTEAQDIEALRDIGALGYVDEDVIPLLMRGASPTFNEDGTIATDAEGKESQKIYESYSSRIRERGRLSKIGKISAINLDPVTPYMDDEFYDDKQGLIKRYQQDFTTWQDLCRIFTNISKKDSTITDDLRVPGLEYYPDDFLYTTYNGYNLNRMITLRRFPLPCIDNIWDNKVQANQDITRMIGWWDDNNNKLDDLLSFSYGLRWKELQAGYEAMQMSGQADNDGLTGILKKGAIAFGDQELIKNRLRGPNGNLIAPDQDNNKAHGPVDSITQTHIRDVGLDFNKEFSIDFFYQARSYGGRNPDAVMKDILANALMCTYNDGEFWGGARYWIGGRPSKALNSLQWMNSDDVNTILKGGWNALKELVTTKFGSGKSAIETLKDVLKGTILQGMAAMMNALGRPGVPFANSLLSGNPVGEWHLTIGHPLNPIMCIGNLICTGVDVNFPTDVLTYGEFPNSLKFTVHLKPAMPLDRAGIEKIFNRGQQRIYVPIVAPVTEKRGSSGDKRDLISTAIDETFMTGYKYTKEGLKSVRDSGVMNTLAKSVQVATKYVEQSSAGQVFVAAAHATSDKTVQITSGVKDKTGQFIATNFTQTVKAAQEVAQ